MPRAAQAVPQVSTAGSTVRRPPTGPSWVRIFVVGLVLWLATVLVTFATENSNLIPTIILLGSFLTPITFVAYTLGRADEVLTAQRIFSAFVYGGLLGVLGASVLESAFLRQPSGLVYLGVGLIEEGVKLAALWLLARRLPRYTMRNGMVLGAAVGFGFAAFESAGYAFNALFTTTGLSLWNLLETEVLRGILTPVGHGLWTAILGGAPVRDRGAFRPAPAHRGGPGMVCAGGAAARAVGRFPGDRGVVDAAAHRHPSAVAADRVRSRAGRDPGAGAPVHGPELGAAGAGCAGGSADPAPTLAPGDQSAGDLITS
jgi:RsiW-degrading membrane proteinase PrsW (M82 family)